MVGKSKRNIWFLLMVAILPACVQPVGTEGFDFSYEDTPVVNCFFTPAKPFCVHVSLTASMYLDTAYTNIEDAVVSLLSLCAEHGFLEASVTPSVQVNDSAHMALVDFSLHEGGRSRIGSIVISGADGCRPYVIRRELSFAEGDTVKYSELIGSQRRLYLTGLFESVFVRPAPPTGEDSTEREIRVEVKEKPSGELSFSVGYGTVEKVRGRTELSISNLAGTARKAGIGVENPQESPCVMIVISALRREGNVRLLQRT